MAMIVGEALPGVQGLALRNFLIVLFTHSVLYTFVGIKVVSNVINPCR
jgi:hypothetical protein